MRFEDRNPRDRDPGPSPPSQQRRSSQHLKFLVSKGSPEPRRPTKMAAETLVLAAIAASTCAPQRRPLRRRRGVRGVGLTAVET
jgi:hypothetical protein